MFITGVGLLSGNRDKEGFSFSSFNKQSSQKTVTVNNNEISVEIANTEAQRSKGLSQRESLANDHGMLFVFTAKDIKPPFWMKGMKIPIDIIWINDSEIVQIDDNIQPPDKTTPESELVLFLPMNPIDYVLEVPAGYSEKSNIKVGDKINLTKALGQ